MDTPVMRVLKTMYCWFVLSSLLMLGLLGLLAACTSSSDRPGWIRNGVTTKHDVIARYGQPDVLIAAPGGDAVIYRPTETETDREGTVFLRNELRLHYDARDVVQGLSSP